MKTKVLFLCTGNSCRSIMAEALLNHLGHADFEAYSAGSHPTGQVHAGALDTLARHGIPAGTPQSKSWDDVKDMPFDIVVTVCDAAAAESCPVFLGPAAKKHWSTPDPAHVTGTQAEITAAFDQAFNMLATQIRTLIGQHAQLTAKAPKAS